MHNFEKRVVIHDGAEVPSDSKYCLVLLENGMMQRAFYYTGEWIFCNEYLPEQIIAWCYIEDLFKQPKNVDIRMYIGKSESRI